MQITGYDVMKLCEQGSSCKACQLCNKKFKVDIALEQQFNHRK